jgi:sialate O-acetylesterase
MSKKKDGVMARLPFITSLRQLCFAGGLASVAVVFVHAEVRLPAVFADHMVVQRDIPVHVWGYAQSNEAVSVAFRGETRRGTADELGRWSLYLPPGGAGGPFEMEVQGTNKIALEDVLVGDVWIASGQSNMEFPMVGWENGGVNNTKEEIAAAKFPNIRLLDLGQASSDFALDNVVIRHPWSECTPASVATFSAIGYFFARDVQEHENVPIGVIDVSWGGTPAEAWTSLDALSADASLMPVFARRAKLMDEATTAILRQRKEQADYENAKAAGKQIAPPGWHPDPASWKPGGIYNGMIAPLIPFPIKGVIWYQGESNGDPDGAPTYARLFQTMIQDWRSKWGQGDFPFLFVQIANWGEGKFWPDVREAQRQTLVLKNTAMAVSIDIGDPIDIHPKNKQDVGFRLSLAARAVAYGEHIEYSGPLFRAVTIDGSALRIRFDHAESGLTAKKGAPTGFTAAAADEKYVPAQARIDGDTVLVSADSINDPVYVRYGWAANPDCDLLNGAGLPASPFEAKALHSNSQ